MEGIKTYKVNLDYERSLFDPNYQLDSVSSAKIIREFEYVFFLVETKKSILKNYRNYDLEYLKQMEKLGFIIPDFNSLECHYENWWGASLDIAMEKKLNSKLTSAALALENEWGFHQGKVVENVEQALNHLKKYPEILNWIVKNPFSFSGIGHYQFSSDNINLLTLENLLINKSLLEPVYDRVFDIGTTFEILNGKILRQFMVENFNSKSGAFKGGAGASTVGKFKNYIQNKYNYSLDKLEKTTLEIANKYLAMGAISNIQIDSFIYNEKGILKPYFLVEVNYRKTMGLVIQSLADKYQNLKNIEWIIKSKNELKNSSLDSRWIKLSPAENKLQSFLNPGPINADGIN